MPTLPRLRTTIVQSTQTQKPMCSANIDKTRFLRAIRWPVRLPERLVVGLPVGDVCSSHGGEGRRALRLSVCAAGRERTREIARLSMVEPGGSRHDPGHAPTPRPARRRGRPGRRRGHHGRGRRAPRGRQADALQARRQPGGARPRVRRDGGRAAPGSSARAGAGRRGRRGGGRGRAGLRRGLAGRLSPALRARRGRRTAGAAPAREAWRTCCATTRPSCSPRRCWGRARRSLPARAWMGARWTRRW